MLSRAASTARAARSLLHRAPRSDALRSRNSSCRSIVASPAEAQKRRAIDASGALPAAAAAAAPQLALGGAANAAAPAAAAAAVAAPPEGNPAAPAASSSSASSLDEHFMRLALGQARQAALRGEVPVGALLVSRCGGAVLAAAGNGVEAAGDATAHAELLCLQRAAAGAAAEAAAPGRGGGGGGGGGGASSSISECSTSSSPLLSSSSAAAPLWPRSATAGSTLYVTLEPCAMCAGAALLARVGRIVYGARNAGAGADGSWVSLLPRGKGGEGEGEGQGEGEGEGGEEGASFPYPSLTPLPSRPHHSHPALEVTRGVLAQECGGLLKDFFRKRRAEGTRGGGGGGGGNGGSESAGEGGI